MAQRDLHWLKKSPKKLQAIKEAEEAKIETKLKEKMMKLMGTFKVQGDQPDDEVAQIATKAQEVN